MRMQRKEQSIEEWKRLPKGGGIWASRKIWNIFFWQKLGAIHLGQTALPVSLALRKSRVKKWMDSSIIFPSAFVWSCKSPSWVSRRGTFSTLPLAPHLCRQTITHGHVDGSASLLLQPDYLPSLDCESSPEWASSCLWVTQSHGYLIIFYIHWALC